MKISAIDDSLGRAISKREFKAALHELAIGNEVYAQIVVFDNEDNKKQTHFLSLEVSDDYQRIFLRPLTFDAPVVEIYSDDIENNVEDLNYELCEYTDCIPMNEFDYASFWILFRF